MLWRVHTQPGQASSTTQSSSTDTPAAQIPPVPGVVVIFANRRPRSRVFRWEGTPLELGRLELAEDDVLDSMISRKHVSLQLVGSTWMLEDLGSRNGTFVAGNRISARTAVPNSCPIRVGGSILTTVEDTSTFQRYGLGLNEGVVAGPSLRKALETVALSARVGLSTSLLITGESGTGKEIAATVFHRSGTDPKAAFVPVNCATIPKELAERLLFGSRRGAFSGATDALGYVQTAHGGTLFLDEVAELPAEVQTKLLRMLETREVLRLGATTHESVDVRVCAATWRDLRKAVAEGRFREDLYFRIGQPEIRLPPLRERIEEIPWHVQHVLSTCGLPERVETTAAFIEACTLRRWPGNVRELRAEIRRAAAEALARARKLLDAEDLAPSAGTPIVSEPSMAAPTRFPDDDVAAALSAEAGNVVGAARRLGVHRNKIRRWLERYGVDARHFKSGDNPR